MPIPTKCPICNKEISVNDRDERAYCPEDHDDVGESHFFYHFFKDKKTGELNITSYEIRIGPAKDQKSLFFISSDEDKTTTLTYWLGGGTQIYHDSRFIPYDKDFVFKFIERVGKLKAFT